MHTNFLIPTQVTCCFQEKKDNVYEEGEGKAWISLARQSLQKHEAQSMLSQLQKIALGPETLYPSPTDS